MPALGMTEDDYPPDDPPRFYGYPDNATCRDCHLRHSVHGCRREHCSIRLPNQSLGHHAFGCRYCVNRYATDPNVCNDCPIYLASRT